MTSVISQPNIPTHQVSDLTARKELGRNAHAWARNSLQDKEKANSQLVRDYCSCPATLSIKFRLRTACWSETVVHVLQHSV